MSQYNTDTVWVGMDVHQGEGYDISLKLATYTFSKNLCTYFRQLRMEE